MGFVSFVVVRVTILMVSYRPTVPTWPVSAANAAVGGVGVKRLTPSSVAFAPHLGEVFSQDLGPVYAFYFQKRD